MEVRLSYKNPFGEVLLDFVANKTESVRDECFEEIVDLCVEKEKCTPAHINTLVGYAVLRDRWIDFEIEFIDTHLEFQFDAHFPCGWCVPCETGVPLLWNFQGEDFQIAPGTVNVAYECHCFPDDYCDPGYGLLYNFETGEFNIAPGVVVMYEECNCFPQEYCDPAYGLLYNFATGEFNMAPGIVNLCDLCISPMIYDFSRGKFNLKSIQIPKNIVLWT